jgi:hypothetical protein
MIRRIIMLVACLAAVPAVEAQAGCPCSQCRSQCCKYCKLVPDVKKVTTFKYCVECEDICLPGRSKCLGWKQVCECGKSECVKCMQPTCSCIRTRRKLVKMPVVEEHHGWKCVVVCKCRGCNHCMAAREATPTELQLALDEADRQGILQVSHEEPIFVTLPEEASTQAEVAPVAEDSAPVLEQSAAPGTVRRATSAFGSLFGND